MKKCFFEERNVTRNTQHGNRLPSSDCQVPTNHVWIRDYAQEGAPNYRHEAYVHYKSFQIMMKESYTSNDPDIKELFRSTIPRHYRSCRKYPIRLAVFCRQDE